MLRIILVALIAILPALYYLIYFFRKKFISNDVKPSDYENIKWFSIVVGAIFVFYIGLLVFKLQEFSGENIKPAVYKDGKIIKQNN